MMGTTQQKNKSGRQLLAHLNKNGKEHLNKATVKATGDLVGFKIIEKITPLKTKPKLQHLSVQKLLRTTGSLHQYVRDKSDDNRAK